jgi:protein-S-isoprenylcysteine O-methyltransferase Ste14
MMKEQMYFFDVIAFVVMAAMIWMYTPASPRLYAGMSLMAVSLVLWMVARLQLGASFSLTANARKLITTGLYARIRNPIYVFGQLAYLGLAIAWGTWVGYVVVALLIPMQLLRARKESAVLEQAFGAEYREYRARTWF